MITEEQAIDELVNEVTGAKKIDWNKATAHDNVAYVEDTIQGVTALLDALTLAHETGTHPYEVKAYTCLNRLLYGALSELEDIKSGVDYMQDVIRK